MSQQRLNDLMILYVHRDSLDELDMDMIREDFVAASSEARVTVSCNSNYNFSRILVSYVSSYIFTFISYIMASSELTQKCTRCYLKMSKLQIFSRGGHAPRPS